MLGRLVGGLLSQQRIFQHAAFRTQDPHHPYVFGARVVIAHPLQKQYSQ